jgi:polysaccharide export outer membrane protein
MKTFISLFLGLVIGMAGVVHAGDYIIGAGDVLQVSVWGVPELSVEVTVRPDGKITLPATGDVPAAGLTAPQLGDTITRQLEHFVKKPIVTLTVAQITNNRVYVSGGGIPSRVINLPGRTTLFKFLCQLEDLESTDLNRAYLLRNGERLPFDFYKLFIEGDFSQDVVLEPEDIVFVPNRELNKIYVVGAVREPKYIYYRKGLKVLDAILEAGGFNEFADKNDVVILRADENKKIILRLKDLIRGKDLGENVLLQPRDYIVVAEGIF